MSVVEQRRTNPEITISPPPQFFVNQKRGEISELRTLLKSLPAESTSNPNVKSKRREVLKKLIAYMTLGIDVSPLFSDVVLASATSDPVQKKLLSLYMSNYAELNPELSILAINALQKDMLDVDPRIRGLALKALTSLRVPSVVEYAESAVRSGLEDPASYVRKSAIMGVLKLLMGSKADIADQEALLAGVRRGLQSMDSQLFVNALLVLNEVQNGFEANRRTIVQLFNKMEHSPLFGRVLILSLLTNFTPKDENEMLGLLDVLEGNFSISHASLLLSTIKVMLMFAKSQIPASIEWTSAPLIISIVKRAKPSLLTLLSSSSMESVFVLLTFIHQLLRISPSFVSLFQNDWPYFTLRYIDKSYNKQLKLCILGQVASENTWIQIKDSIMVSLSPPTCVSREVLRTALKVLGNIANKFPGAASEVLASLAALTSLDIPQLTSAVTPVVASVLAKYPDLANEILPSMNLVFTLETLDEDAVRAAIWMAGEFPDAMPYAAEMIDHLSSLLFESQEAISAITLNDLMICCCKMIFVNPYGIRDVFVQLLQKISENIHKLPPMVVDRFANVCALLQKRPQLLMEIYSPKALAKERQNQSLEGLSHVVSPFPEVPVQRLDTLRSIVDEAECADFVRLPFGGYYASSGQFPLPTSSQSMATSASPTVSPRPGGETSLVSIDSPSAGPSVVTSANVLLDIT